MLMLVFLILIGSSEIRELRMQHQEIMMKLNGMVKVVTLRVPFNVRFVVRYPFGKDSESAENGSLDKVEWQVLPYQ